jgi:NHL repeat
MDLTIGMSLCRLSRDANKSHALRWMWLGAVALAVFLSVETTALAAKTIVNQIQAPRLTLSQESEGKVPGGYFKTPVGVAVNQTGAGSVPAGTFYVVDSGDRRIQRFSPAGAFVSAWGWNVRAAKGEEFEVCTVAESCLSASGGSGAGQLSAPGGVVVDQATGNVYVADSGEHRVDVFKASGAFEGTFGQGVLNHAGELQFCTALTNCSSASAGPAAGQLGAAIGGVAVAPAGSPNAGDVYVADEGNRRVDEFKPTIESGIVVRVSFVRGFGWGVLDGKAEFEVCTASCKQGLSGPGLGEFASAKSPSAVVLDSEGDVFALDNNTTERVEEFSAAPAPLTAEFGSAALGATFGTGELQNVAVDPSVTPNRLLVSGKRSTGNVAVEELEHSGTAVETDGSALEATSSGGLAAVQTSLGGNVYLSSGGADGVVYVLNDTTPTIGPPTPVNANSATLHGEVVSEGFEVTYHFEYISEPAFQTNLKHLPQPLPGFTGATSFPVPDGKVGPAAGKVVVSTEAKGLVGSQLYHLRLVADRPLGGGIAISPETTFTTGASAPTISGVAASAITSTAASLDAQLNPDNQATTYRFQYISEAQYAADGQVFGAGAASVPGPGEEASAGAGGVPVAVAEGASSLHPATAYRFRLLAKNPTGATISEEGTFTTYPTALEGLPDGRAYEQVSPVDKAHADAAGAPGFVRASPTGDAVTFYSAFPFPGDAVPGATQPVVYLASRTTGGWSTQGLLPSSSPAEKTFVEGLNEDLTDSVVGVEAPGEPVLAPGAESGKGNYYVHDSVTGSYSLLAVGGIFEPKVQPLASTPDGSHILFTDTATGEGEQPELRGSNGEFLGRNEEGAPQLYEWSAGDITRVGVLPGETPEKEVQMGAVQGTLPGPGGEAIGGAEPEDAYDQNAISSDGSRALFTANVEAVDGERGIVYMRENPGAQQSALSGLKCTEPAKACTVQVSAGLEPAYWRAATTSGSFVFYTEGEKLYRFNIEKFTHSAEPELKALEEAREELASGKIEGVLGISEEGGYAYYASMLGSGKVGLYEWHEGVGPSIKIAEVESEENTIWGEFAKPGQPTGADSGYKASRVSADGTILLVDTQQKLTSYENGEGGVGERRCGTEAIAGKETGCFELYRYDASTHGPFTCVSCNPTGLPAVNEAVFGRAERTTLKPGSNLAIFLTRNLSSDGSRIFFQTREALLSTATDGVSSVYEWEAFGAGSCREPAPGESPPGYVAISGGCLYLISGGTEPAEFGDASVNGEDVFFFTRQPLVGQDTDQNTDIYDARMNGGISSQNPSPTSPPCGGEVCRGSSGTPPVFGTLSSSAFSGVGNTAPLPAVTTTTTCKKGYIKKKDKCVKKPKPKKKPRAKKSPHTKAGKTGVDHGRAGR